MARRRGLQGLGQLDVVLVPGQGHDVPFRDPQDQPAETLSHGVVVPEALQADVPGAQAQVMALGAQLAPQHHHLLAHPPHHFGVLAVTVQLAAHFGELLLVALQQVHPAEEVGRVREQLPGGGQAFGEVVEEAIHCMDWPSAKIRCLRSRGQ